MHALITRPLEDAKPLADLLAAKGVECTIEPLLDIVPRADAVVDLAGVQALLFTSANGVRAFAAKSSRRDLKVLTVGDGSAAAAREAGFGDVQAAGGDVDALAALAVARLDPKSGPLFHGAASALAGDLQGKLEAAGFTLRRAVLYEAKTATAFSPETRMNLALGGIDMVLLFSPRTARTFGELWQAAEEPSLRKTSALCLSPAVAKEIGALDWQKVEIADRPDQPAMLALVEAEIARRTPAVEILPPPPKPESPKPGSMKTEPTRIETVNAERIEDTPPREERRRPEAPPPPPLPPRPQPAPRPTGGILAGLIAGAIAAAVVAVSAPYWQPMILGQAAPSTDPDVAALQARVAALESAGKSAASQDDLKKALGGAADDAKNAAQQVAQLSDRIGKLEQDMASRSNTNSPAPATDLQGLQFRLAKLETDLTQVSQQVSNQSATTAAVPPDLSGQIAALKSANDDLTQQLAAARDAIKTLQSQQGTLQTQQSTLSGTVEKIAAQPPAVTADEQRRTALVVALGSLRGALALDRPYDAGLKSVDDLVAADAALKEKLAPALDPLRPLAGGGAPTLAQLQASLPAKDIAEAANVEAASAAVGADQGWSERLINRLSEAVTVRPVGEDVQGDGPLPRLARGEAKLKGGDLSGAVAEIEGLTGKPGAAAAGWLAQAKARLAQVQAGANLDQAATALLAPPEQ